MTGLASLKEGKIWNCNGKVILTDFPGNERPDAVFPICRENCYFAKHILAPKNGAVLDMCTGSGVLAIFAAEKATKVIAVDINPRALEFARFNAVLNGVENKIEFRQGNLWEPVKNEKFNLVMANPPFEPRDFRPLSRCLHSDGGNDGTAIIQRVVSCMPNYLIANGTFQMIAWFLEDRSSVLEKLKNHFSDVQTDELGEKKIDIGLIKYIFITALNFEGGDGS
ncbi:MAG: hypothetical protein A3I88_00235 [Candidatus Portnoybacteria bacterium RIFCSPLOWO2_12_FULL_39_9]|uniref:Methyltransferase small domain-containing protein n=1 Tax=Candidatus Portnoybacteria bacterium RIFCSPHIGHO2_12_FULL_38_9 TaxID=1801997 RepID=A0A1G2FH67_9BACT|nr:MAG: hypothetical protein A3J64_01760 [Candidatus Portnoybacteria bacterium RIFCSPHIGHO2_12_FULL_38_9]OGZ41154.1 MAG: hypothetical protein A3I88_00235 [Candidatus Portnoybacteria bacterium RIFCSPLOWO2_12_FULL_39_9]